MDYYTMVKNVINILPNLRLVFWYIIFDSPIRETLDSNSNSQAKKKKKVR